jgi:uncharacterized membrane protein
MSGLLWGGVAGILRSTSPTLVALACGIEWFTVGSTYWGNYRADGDNFSEVLLTSNVASRGLMLNAKGKDKRKPSDVIFASIFAGGIAGCAGGLLRMVTYLTSVPFLTAI